MAILANLALLFAAIFVVCCVLLAAFVGSLLYMVVLHHRLKEQGLGRERGLLATPLPPDAELPHVVVQIPSFNEGPVLRRGVEAAARLDWPRDKLHIQVLDDSSPGGGSVTTLIGVAGQNGVVTGELPARLNHPSGLAVLPGGSLAISDEQAILILR